ncbi:MAG: hypothetical protein KDA91_05040, partial [Planctomycetaceae bacterium]|nr:hypothetical protein [Planctomycetaceae bacterium]
MAWHDNNGSAVTFVKSTSAQSSSRKAGAIACLSILSLLCTAALPGQVNAQQEKEKAGEKTKPQTEEPAAESERNHEYVRIRKNDRRLAVALETSVVTMTDSPDFPGATVDLIGAVHLGETGYYEKLNAMFQEYDVVLFEAVMPEEAVRRNLRPGGKASAKKALTDEDEWTEAKVGLTAISVLQLGMKDALGLDFQLSAVDYTNPNFVHADMTAEQFEETMKSRGESFSQMLAREMAKAMGQEQNPLATNLDVVLSALSNDRVYRIRRIAAAQLAKAGDID